MIELEELKMIFKCLQLVILLRHDGTPLSSSLL